MARMLSVLVLVPALAWGQQTPPAPAPTTQAPAPEAAAAAAPASKVPAQIDALWSRRDQPGVVQQIDALVSAGLKANPKDYEVLWRGARLRFWQADGSTDDRFKKQIGREGWNLGDRAIEANNQRAEGYYYGGVSMGAYSQAIGILKALGEGLEGKYNERIDKAIQMNPDLDAGGPLIAKGRYYFELPWPKRDLKKSRDFYERAMSKHPEALRIYLYLADTQLKDGDAKAARETIEKAFGPVTYDPPEGRRVHELAAALKARIEEKLR